MKTNKLIRLMVSSILIASLVTIQLIVSLPLVKVSADTQYTYYSDDGGHDGYWNAPGIGTYNWATLCSYDTPSVATNSMLSLGYTEYTDYKWAGLQQMVVGFDVDTLPAGTITSMKVRLYCTSKLNEKPWAGSELDYGMFTSPLADNTIDAADFDNLYDGGSFPYGAWHNYDDLTTSAWEEFDISPGDWASVTPDANGYVWFWFALRAHMGNDEPNNDGQYISMQMRFEDYDNSGGTGNKPEFVITTDSALTVETNDANYITAATAVLNGEITAFYGYDDVPVGFEWGETTGYEHGFIDGFPDHLDVPGTFSYPLMGLTPGETYHFRAWADPGTGKEYGDDKAFITQSGAPVNNLTVVTQTADDLANTTATLNGEITALGNYLPVVVGFRYGKFSGYWTEHSVGNQSTVGAFDYALTGLRAGTTYYCQAYARDAAGIREGDILSFTTTGVYSPLSSLTVITNMAYPIGENYLRLTGTLNSLGTNSLAYVGFDWGLTTSYGSIYDSPYARTTECGFDYIITSGLTAGQTIHYRAGAIGDTGEVAWGADMTVVVGEAPIGSPIPTPPPTGTPPPIGSPIPIGPIDIPGSWNTILGRYLLVLVGMILGPIVLMFVLGGATGKIAGGLFDCVIFTAAVISGWIDVWVLVLLLIVAAYLIWKVVLSPRGA